MSFRIKSAKTICQGTIYAFLFIAVGLCIAVPSVSDDFSDRRITAGAKIFRALLAADFDITQKTDRDGSLRLGLVYIDDAGNAERAKATLLNRDDSRIRKMNVAIEIIPFADYVSGKTEFFAGVFLTQTLSDQQFKSLTKHSIEQHFIVFSPFEGDVERGAQCGIIVEARVRPYLNTKALHIAGIRLKSFFIRVAKQYEE